MKHIKKIFKQAFGNHKTGTQILAEFKKADVKSPILFAFSSDTGSDNFVEWIKTVFTDVAIVDAQTFVDEGKNIPNAIICVKGVKDLNQDMIKRALKLRKKGKGIAIAIQGKPTSLDYIYDPSFTVANMEGFDLAIASEEIGKFAKKVSKYMDEDMVI
jgi:hypothetical protein